MSVIYCHHCDKLIDSDFIGCVEDPDNPLEMMCEEHLEDEDEPEES